MIPNWLLQRAYLTPDRMALSFKDKQWTFSQLFGRSIYHCQKLRGNGLHEGDRIALLGRSTPRDGFCHSWLSPGWS